MLRVHQRRGGAVILTILGFLGVGVGVAGEEAGPRLTGPGFACCRRSVRGWR